MAKREILVLPDQRLRQVADEIPEVDDSVKKLAADMLETMYAAPGIGLAAPQVGEMKRLVVMDLSKDGEKPDPIVLINPEIKKYSEETVTTEEGCLSIPGLTFDCRRRQHVVAHGQNMYGDPVTVEGTALLARIWQHETDHLDGVLFVDRLDPDARKLAMKSIRESEWWGITAPTVKFSPHDTRGLAL